MSEHSKLWDMNSPAWLVHKTWAGAHSARILLFTREQGLIWAKCYGGWSPKKQAVLQAFTPLWIELNQRQNGYELRRVEIAGSPFELSGMYLFSALYVNELLYSVLRPEDPHIDLYDAYVSTLQTVSLVTTQSDLERILRRFEWQVLSSIGYAMSLTHDAEAHNPIIATQYYDFQPGLGFITAPNGMLVADILALAKDDLNHPRILKIAKYLMRRALDYALGGKTIKSRALFSTNHSAPVQKHETSSEVG